MFNTARNFWKMIDDRNVTAIVMLCQENENNQVILTLYLALNNCIAISYIYMYCRKCAISTGLHQQVD